ncbi:hypothetical protein, partial [Proteus terrae]|uniref:hypothetical protein n=1 Tax=Proteus terrae TaxID=1574161 RepID=UPI00301E1370
MKITQSKHIEKIVVKINMQNCNGAKTPMIKGFQVDNNENIIHNVPYREIIGSLMYISTVSRPDITFATSYL